VAGVSFRHICARAKESSKGNRFVKPFPGGGIDEAVAKLLFEAMTPMALEVALAVQHELDQRLEDVDRLRRQQVERARYEADLAQRRYMQVDPGNRLVADALEADWNEKLRLLAEAQEQYRQQQQANRIFTFGSPRARAKQVDSPSS
jgi:hypothetical protein